MLLFILDKRDRTAEISQISDKLYNESLREFQILNGAASTGNLTKVILTVKIVY